MRRCLARWPRRAPSWIIGVSITTACVPTRRSPTGHRKSSEPSISPLRSVPATVKTSTLDSTPEWMKEGAQLRIDTDNDTVFINETVKTYCDAKGMGRPAPALHKQSAPRNPGTKHLGKTTAEPAPQDPSRRSARRFGLIDAPDLKVPQNPMSDSHGVQLAEEIEAALFHWVGWI